MLCANMVWFYINLNLRNNIVDLQCSKLSEQTRPSMIYARLVDPG